MSGDFQSETIAGPISYKDEIAAAMVEMAKDPLIRFVGYGVRDGGRAGGSLKNVPDHMLIETPVAENLMVGMAIGLALRGLRPVVYIERFDFMLNALDAIVNHLDKAKVISRGEFDPRVIIRAFVGKQNKPLYTGATHTQDFSVAMRHLVSFPIQGLLAAEHVAPAFEYAHNQLSLERGHSTLLVEYGDLM